MKAVLFEAFGETPTIRNVPDPTSSAEGVVVKVAATGLCRSDWHGWMGHDADIRLPHVPGHELAGTIMAVGKQVTRWKEGDRVTVPFVAGCGRCVECASGNQQGCESQYQPGFTAWGSYAEYVALDFADTNLVALPDSMEFATAASSAAVSSPRSARWSTRAVSRPANGLPCTAAAASACRPS